MDEIVSNINDYIRKVAIQGNISSEHVFFLICSQSTVNVATLDPSQVLSLVEKGYYKNGKITELGKSILNVSNFKETSNNTDYSLPKLTEETANITKRLASHFLADRFQGREFKEYQLHCKNNVIMSSMFFIFMNMFPTADKTKNIPWNEHFETVWTNVTLRRVTSMTIKKFNQVYKSKDMGLFLLGTYMFIKESYNADRGVYYIKNLENYWREYEGWYNRASEMLETGQLESFTKTEKKQNQNNNTIMI